MTVDVVRDSYDAKAEVYTDFALGDLDRVRGDRDWLASFAELARPLGGQVADLGCGPGHIVNHLTTLGLEAFGCDFSPAMIAEAQRIFPDLDFQIGNLRDLDVDGSCLAGIVSRYSLIHISPEELGRIFSEWFRVLVPQAPLLISFFASPSAETHGKPFDHAIAKAYALFPATVVAELEQAGFVECKIGVRDPLDGERPLDHGTILAEKLAP